MLTIANGFGEMRNLDEVCRDCDYREVGCHSKCRRYKNYKMMIEAIRKKRDKEKEYFDYLRERKLYKE